MKHKKLTSKQNYIIRIPRGEDVIENIKKFCEKNKIFAGSFFGIGACDLAELGSYSVKTKKYTKKEFKGEYEITSILGIISDKKIHAHANIVDSKFKSFGGHVNKMQVSATCEIHLIACKGTLKRKLDKQIGLELLDL